MKDTLRTRLEFLWAKLAGRDVDIGTLTPDAPTSMVEKLMLETADRIGEAAGGGSGGLAPLFVDTEFVSEEGYVAYYKTNVFAADIEAAYKQGRHVLIHCPEVQDYGNAECLFSICGWIESEPYDDEAPYTIMYGYGSTIGWGYAPSFTAPYILEDGTLALRIYVD